MNEFGMIGDGVSDDTDAFLSAVADAYTRGIGMQFMQRKNYVLRPFVLTQFPTFIDFGGSSLIAAAAADAFCTIERPFDFRFGNVVINAQNLCKYGFLLQGSQIGNYYDVFTTLATENGIAIHGSAGHGVYYNTFSRMTCSGNGRGFSISGDNGFYVAANTHIAPRSIYNHGHGYDITYCSDTFIGPDSEGNDLYGFRVGTSYSLDFVGGYSENNHQNRTSGQADGTPDESFLLGADSTGVKITGRHIGAISGQTNGKGNWIAPSNKPSTPTLDALGHMFVAGINLSDSGESVIQMNGGYMLGFTPDAKAINQYKVVAKKPVGASSNNGKLSITLAPIVEVFLSEDITEIVMPVPVDGAELTIVFQQHVLPKTVSGWPGNVSLSGGTFMVTQIGAKRDLLKLRYLNDFGRWFEEWRSQNV